MVGNRRQRLNKGVRRETWDEGVFCNILSRLSVKSICSLKTVCKSWNDLTSTTFFAKKHYSRSKENPTFISCPSMDASMKLYSVNPKSLELSSLNTVNPAAGSDEDSMYMISSFQGRICFINQISDEDLENRFCDLQIWIGNPCTGETLLLPRGRPSFEIEPSVGVAYGSDTTEYRVFRIFCAGKETHEDTNGRLYTKDLYECEVYSSSSGSWKNIGQVPRVPMRACLSPYRSAHTYVGGKIFWLVSLDKKGEMLSVDLEGKFEVHKLPPYPKNLKGEDKITEATFLINLKGSLSLVIQHPYDMDVWVWKKEGDEFGWENVCQCYTPFKYDEIVLAMTSSKNQILCVTETHWWTFNMDTGRWRKKKGPRSGFDYPSIFPFTESFFTCNGVAALD